MRMTSGARKLRVVTAALIAGFLFSGSVLAQDGMALRRIPVGDQALAFQGGYILHNENLVGTVIGARESKSYFGTGDTLYLRFIRNLDIHMGDWVTVYHLTTPVFHPITTVYMGRLVKILGILEVTSEPTERVTEARVIRAFDSISAGTPVMLYAPPPEIPDLGSSEEPLTGAIVEFKEKPREVTAQGEIVYIDLGTQDGLGLGDRLKVIRPGKRESLKSFLPDYILGEVKVIGLQERTATTKVVKSQDGVRRGDFVTRAPAQTARSREERVVDPVAMLPRPDQEPEGQKSPESPLKPVYFAFDRWSFAEADLNEVRQFLAEHPTVNLLIEGHADEIGTSEYNLVLGEKRARAISRYLEGLGVKNSISVTSYGKERPVCMGQDEACHSRNRRAQFVVQAD